MARDYRLLAYDAARIDASAKSVGWGPYWKLYTAENLIRIIVNTVLLLQVGPDWWVNNIDPKIQEQAARFSRRHAGSPWHSSQGRHGVYYTFLGDLGEILRANGHLFLPIIPDVDQWIARIEQVRLPRNVVGHMNFPTATDRKRIDVFYSDVKSLAAKLEADGIAMRIP